MSTSSSGSGGSTNHSTNPTSAKHQLVSPEGFLRPVEVPERVTKLVIYVGGDKEKLEATLRVCEEINSIKSCTDLGTLFRRIKAEPQKVKYLVFNYRKSMTFTFIAKEEIYNRGIQKGALYEVSYDLFIEKLRWAGRALLLEKHVKELSSDWV